MAEWLSFLIQAGGAVTVCGMFIWYLIQKQKADEESRKQFLDHMATAQEKHLEYMQARDAQSKEIAMSGHAALSEITEKVAQLRGEIQKGS